MESQQPRARTLADAIYQRLREDILHGYLRPNELLVETELAERLQASRTPVREGLQRLAKDGLVVSKSRRWLVVEQTSKDIRDIYDVRAALESHAARLASERATDEHIDTIFKALYSRGEAGPGLADFVTSNELFHTLIIDAAGNPRLSEATEQSKQFYFNTQLAHLYTPEELAISHQQHKALAEAIRDRDGDAADRITRAHIAHAFAIITERWPG
jgi:DNA-binding GntR family transcriptional regulator